MDRLHGLRGGFYDKRGRAVCCFALLLIGILSCVAGGVVVLWLYLRSRSAARPEERGGPAYAELKLLHRSDTFTHETKGPVLREELPENG